MILLICIKSMQSLLNYQMKKSVLNAKLNSASAGHSQIFRSLLPSLLIFQPYSLAPQKAKWHFCINHTLILHQSHELTDLCFTLSDQTRFHSTLPRIRKSPKKTTSSKNEVHIVRSDQIRSLPAKHRSYSAPPLLFLDDLILLHDCVFRI
jgi:hypothetical protein